MSATERADRLRIDTRLACLENIKVLSRQLTVALEQNKKEEAVEIQGHIGALLNVLDELSQLSLQLLEDSQEVKDAIKGLRGVAEDLEDEADNIESVAKALERGAEIVAKATGIIAGVRRLLPV